eukprot:TRINITY_DN14807_c0_g1_i1.p1 TRINITY_DN14807_c0_g1~~TRINITY_DN14807_c0_g1_i1.p1  ORF type:complete len:401 (-),score=150.80 TRINITY_DN14807_c0_g1_i1:405-1607(-)
MHTVYIPHLLGLTEEFITEQAKEKPILEEGLRDMIAMIAREHRDFIVKEYRRRLNKMEDSAGQLADRAARRQARAIKRRAREHAEWLNDLKTQIENQVVAKAVQVDDPTAIKVLEMGMEESGQALYTIGGLLGELLITVGKIFEVLTEPEPEGEEQPEPEPSDEPAPSAPSLELTPNLVEEIIRSAIEPFLASEATIDIPLLCNSDFEEILNEEDPRDVIDCDNLVTPGLKYLVRKMERYGFSSEVAAKVFAGIVRFKNKKLPELKELIPEVPPVPEEKLSEMLEEEKAAEKERIAKENESIAAQNEELRAKNEELQKENEATSQLQGKIRIVVSPQTLEHGKTCAVAWIGPIDEGRAEGEVAAKRNPKVPQVSIAKHLCVGNTVSDLKLIIQNRRMVAT